MAGVLPYTRQNDEIYVLLGQERGGNNKGTYDMFSGKVDQDENKIEAAARETYEESAGLLGKMRDIQQNMFPLNHSGGTFLMEVKDPSKLTNHDFTVQKGRHQYSAGRFHEKTDLQWVKLSDLVDACVNNNGILKQNKKELSDLVDAGVHDKQNIKEIEIRPYFSKIIAHNADYLMKEKFLKDARYHEIQIKKHQIDNPVVPVVPVKPVAVKKPIVDKPVVDKPVVVKPVTPQVIEQPIVNVVNEVVTPEVKVEEDVLTSSIRKYIQNYLTSMIKNIVTQVLQQMIAKVSPTNIK